MSVDRANRPTRAYRELLATQESVNAISMHMRFLCRRLKDLEQMGGGRDALLPEERVEYDLIGASFIDLQLKVQSVTRA